MAEFDIQRVIDYVKLNTGRKKPDYIMYYTLNTVNVDTLVVGSTVYASYFEQLYSDNEYKKKFGRMTVNYNVFDINNTNNHHKMRIMQTKMVNIV